ncbi:uncharacterized protein LOC121388101 [Gigantopelta aegis]|uniref:uncharacterized protein LOC121388101 n=1 Tax=Gigantopelta aegis TaxID=1735272 RepID=UPI001B88B942|nr:uncharacterized protein LOC121388101 [Gigantopelta aegis]
MNLFKSITHGIDDRLALSRSRGIPVKTAKMIFSKQDHTHKVYVRNKDCWAYGLDLTSISPWNSDLRNRKAGTLVSPRHMLWARHYSIHVNKTVRFVDANNNVIERRVISTHLVNRTAHDHFYGKDIVVGFLDKDVPSTISFARVMPREILYFRPQHSTRLPVLSTDQEEKALVADFNYYYGSGVSLRTPIANSTRHEFFERIIGGDSGNPNFFVINQQIVLLFVLTTGGAGGGTNINHWYDAINSIMEQQGGGYQLTEASLHGFLDHQHHSLPNIVG